MDETTLRYRKPLPAAQPTAEVHHDDILEKPHVQKRRSIYSKTVALAAVVLASIMTTFYRLSHPDQVV